MKKVYFSIAYALLCNIAVAQVSFKNLSYAPNMPVAGESFSFTYNTSHTDLEKEKNVDVAVYLFSSNGGLKVVEPEISRTGKLLSGSVLLDSNTNAIGFSFSADDVKDLNGGNGYIVPVYQYAKPVAGYYLTMSDLSGGYGEYLFGIENSKEKSLKYLEDALANYKELKTDSKFLSKYLPTLTSVKKAEANPVVAEYLDNYIRTRPVLSEEDYQFLVQFNARMKNKTAADSLTKVMQEKYPGGNWVKTKALQEFFTEKNAARKEALYAGFITKYPATEKDKSQYDYYLSQVARAYAGEKNYEAYNKWIKDLSPENRASLHNSISWNMAEEDLDLEAARKMSYDATMYARGEMEHPAGKKPDGITMKQWNDGRKTTYGQYADTYAFILYKQGKYAEGFPYAKEAATLAGLKDAELNERYALLAEKVLPLQESRPLVEGFVKEGRSSAKVKDVLKRLYVLGNKSEDGYNAYVSGLEKVAKEKRKAELLKGIIDEPAPNFTLQDMNGKTVSLADMKGKTVVVDFWATWCGPCIASMPGMQTALEKYTGNDKVAFLFVDTWESAEDKVKNAQDFMTKKKYPFYVLMDNDNKMVEDYRVSGIPTKFVIDGNGRIRFKSVGFSGNGDDLADEIATMIDVVAR